MLNLKVEELSAFILGCLENMASLNIPFLSESHTAFKDCERLCYLDSIYHACLVNHVAKRASLQQGHSLLMSSNKAFSLPVLHELQQSMENEKNYGHQVTVFGVLCAALGISVKTSCEIFMFCTLRTIMTSIVRLGKVGALEAQHYQYEFQGYLPDIIQRNENKSCEDAMVVFPILDVFQNSHDALFMKLFFS